MNRLICCKPKLLRFCILLVLMVLLTGCCAYGKTSLRWVTYSETGTPPDAKEVITAANAVSKEKVGVTADLTFQPADRILQTRTGIDRYATRLYQTGSFVNASAASISRDNPADPHRSRRSGCADPKDARAYGGCRF